MQLPGPTKAGTQELGLRFNIVSLLPTAALVALVLALIAAGAPATAPSLETLRGNLRGVSGLQIVALSFAVVAVSIALHPFQLPLVRLLEGYWGNRRPGRALGAIGVELHRRRWQRLSEHEAMDVDELVASISGQPDTQEWAALRAELTRRKNAARDLARMYPRADRLMPTRLGNVLRAAEDEAGQRYGLDTVMFLPRLYPHLSPSLAALIEDLRNQMDAAARLCAVLLLATPITAVLLARHGWWLLIPASTAMLAWVAYRAAVNAAGRWGQMMFVAFDLHRFDMLRGMGLPLPTNPEAERNFNQRLTWELGHNRPVAGYEHQSK